MLCEQELLENLFYLRGYREGAVDNGTSDRNADILTAKILLLEKILEVDKK